MLTAGECVEWAYIACKKRLFSYHDDYWEFGARHVPGEELQAATHALALTNPTIITEVRDFIESYPQTTH